MTSSETEQGENRPNCRSLPWPFFAADAASVLLVLELYHVFGWCLVILETYDIRNKSYKCH